MNHIISLLLIIQGIYSFSCYGQDINNKFESINDSLQKVFGDSFSFSVLIADNEQIQFSNSFGYIDSLKTKKTNQNTLYQIASITKSFTSVAILKLIEQNKINLDDRIDKFFINVPLEKKTISIADLLNHKSGFGQNYVNYGIENSDAAINALLKDSLISNPGSDFKYSNQNFELLALIIESVTDLKYEEYIRKIIIHPLKMTNTFFWDEVNGNSNVASISETFADSLLTRNWDYIGSGGIYSTTGDLYKFISGVITYRVISKQSTQLMFEEQYKTSSGIGISYGWFKNDITDLGGREIWTRGNESWGHNAVIRWFPGKEIIIIVCTNSGEIGHKQNTANRIISDYIINFLWN